MWIVGVELGDHVQEVERPHDVVHLGVDGVLAVDHRVRRAALLREVDDRLGFERTDRLVEERVVVQVADEGLNGVPADLFPRRHTTVHLTDRDEGVDAHLVVVVPTDEVVDDTYLVTALGEVECGRPSKVAVAP